MNKDRKIPIAMRMNKNLMENIDHILPETRLSTRTSFIEEACSVYITYLHECLEREFNETYKK